MNASRWACLVWLGIFLTGVAAFGAEDSPTTEAKPGGGPGVVAVRIALSVPEADASAWIAALRNSLSAAAGHMQLHAYYGLAADAFAERIVALGEPERVVAILDFETSDAATPHVMLEPYHYAFAGMTDPHIESPEYTFKFASDSALLAIHLHGGLSKADTGTTIEIRPASSANASLPHALLRRTVRLVLARDVMRTAGTRDAVANVIGKAVVDCQADRGAHVMGMLPDVVARAQARLTDIEIRVSEYRYPTSEPTTQDVAAENKDAEPIAIVRPFASGLYYVAGLKPLTAYTLALIDTSKAANHPWRTFDPVTCVTASLEGVVRTVPGVVTSYAPIASGTVPVAAAIEPAGALDYVIERATVFDGSRDRERFVADVGVTGERIVAVGDLKAQARKTTIDGAGLFLTPGFVDIHSHADNNVLKVPYAPSHIRQGITTVLGGNCASSPLGIGAFLEKIGRDGAAVNIGMLVGNRPVRNRVMGKRKGQPTYEEAYRQKELVDLAMEEGAFGMSTGLIYSISEEAFTWELAELAKQLKPYGGFYASHVRGETDEVLDAIREAIYIGEIADVPVQISHMKVLKRRNWGGMTRYLEIMKAARARGLDVTGDQYPWRASGPAAHHRLYSILLNQAIREGTPDVVLLKDMPGKYAKYSGKLLIELLDGENLTPIELIAELKLTEKTDLFATHLCLGECDVREAMQADFVMVCTDASLYSLEALAAGKARDEHPRKFRTYPEFFANYVRDKGVCSWELAVHKCTGLPASRMKLADRGTIRPGAFADLVLLDPEALDPGADFRDQAPPPKGIQWVFLNGQPVLREGELTRVRAGRPLHAYGNIKP